MNKNSFQKVMHVASNTKAWKYCHFFLVLCLVAGSKLFSQPVLDRWVEVNQGFAKCAGIGQTAGYANYERDDFHVREMLYKNNEAYAYIEYGNNATNSAPCGRGLFRYDSVTAAWTKVADEFPSAFGSFMLKTNGESIFAVASGKIFEHTIDYATAPNGWLRLNTNEIRPQDFMSCECAPNNCWEGLRFGEYTEVIGDTLYSLVLANDVNTGCSFENRVVKFSISGKTISVDAVGPLPHQIAGDNVNSNHFSQFVFTERIGGIFKYFMSYTWWGGDKCTPNYLWTWDPRDQQWKNISKGVNWKNMTGNSNPEQCVSTTRPAIKWGPTAGFTTSWDKRSIFASSETGIYRWGGDKWYYLADFWGNSGLHPTNNGFYAVNRGGITRLEGANFSPLGQSDFLTCVHERFQNFMTPDDGKTLFVIKNGLKDPAVCDWNNATAEIGVYRLKFDPEKPSRVRNLHVQSATYVGGPGDNSPIGTGVAGKHQVFVAGNFANVTGRNGVPFGVVNLNGSGSSSRGRLINYNTFGDTVRNVINLGNTVYDIEVQNYGKYSIAISGDFGVSVLDSNGTAQKWNIPAASLWDSGDIFVDIDDNGHVVVLRNKKFRTYDENGNPLSSIREVTNADYVEDIAIKNDSVFVVGFNNGSLNGTGCGEIRGLPVQSSFIRAFYLSGGNYSFGWKTFDFPGNQLNLDQADTRGYRVNIGKDGKLYFLGESAGGNSVFRWNGKTNMYLNGCTEPSSRLVSYDQYNTPFNTSDAHIGYYCTINPKTGVVQKGQYVIPRLSSGKSNSFRIKDGYIHADAKGYVYIGGTSAYAIAGRDIQNLNGNLVGDYAGGDMCVLINNPDFSIRNFWGVFTDSLGSGSMKGIGIRDNIISAIGQTDKGLMITGSTRFNSLTGTKDFRKEYAIKKEPFNLDWAGTIPENDAYLAVWYQDVWNHSIKDTLEERKIPGDVIIPEEELNRRANFIANITEVCTNRPVTFSNISVGDSTAWTWNFGEGASLLQGTYGAGPWAVSYSTPGLKKVRLDVLLNRNITDYEEKANYIRVYDSSLDVSSVTGPNLVCAGSSAFYTVGLIPGAKYNWSVPTGAQVVNGFGGNTVEIIFGNTSGAIEVFVTTPCGTTGSSNLYVTVNNASENNFIIVVGNGSLSAEDAALKAKVESLGSFGVVIDDSQINETHAQCAGFIIVSPSADENLVNFKLRNVTAPVIVMNSGLFDEFGLTNGLAGTDNSIALAQSNLNILNNVHELSGQIGLGNKQVYAAPGSVNWGVPSVNAIKIAANSSSIGQVTLFGYETEAMMQGMKAPARRVGSYLQSNGILNLTQNGDTLLARAVCWVRNSCPNSVSITTNNLSKSVFCPKDTLYIPYTATGTFNLGDGNTPTPQLLNLDNNSIYAVNQSFDLGSSLSGYEGTDYLESTNENNYGRFVRYKPEIIYSGIYKISVNFPRDPGAETNVPVEIEFAGGKTTVYVNQSTGSGFIDLGNYELKQGRDNAVTIKTTGTLKRIIADAVKFESVTLFPSGSNRFTAQLSNSSGDFVSPIELGSVVSLNSGTITSLIPFGTPYGNKYRIRVVSSNPSEIGTNNGSDITINGLPIKPGEISGRKYACQSSTIQDYAVNPVPGATSYQWDLPLGTFGTSTTTSINVNFGTATTNEIKVFAENECGRSLEPSKLLVQLTGNAPVSPQTILGHTIVCPQSKEVYVASVVPDVVRFKWILPAGASAIGPDSLNSITVDFSGMADNTSDTIRVIAQGECGESKQTKLRISVNAVNAVPVAGDIIGKAVQCIDTVIDIYSITPWPGATKYNWSLTNGATILGIDTSNVIKVNFNGVASSQIAVSITNACGTSNISNLLVNITDSIPRTNLLFSGDTLCGGDAEIKLFNSQSGVLYQAVKGAVLSGTPVVGTGGNIFLTVSGAQLFSGLNTIKVQADKGTCYPVLLARNSFVLIQSPSTTLGVTGAPVCSGSTGQVFLEPNQSGVIYQVFRGANPISGPFAGTGTGTIAIPIFTSTLPSANYKFTVKASDPNCPQVLLRDTAYVTVKSSLRNDLTIAGDNICPLTDASASIQPSESGVYYRLLYNNIGIGDSISGTGGKIDFNIPSAYLRSGLNKFRFRASNVGCPAVLLIDTVKVSVIRPPDTLLTTVGDTVCSGENGSVKINLSQNGILYSSWIDAVQIGSVKTGTGSALNFTIPAANLSEGLNPVYIQVNNGCTDYTLLRTPNITLSQPLNAPLPVGRTPACGNTFAKSLLPPTRLKYYWQTLPDGKSVALSSTDSILINSPGRLMYLRALNTLTGCWSGTTTSRNFTVNANPVAPDRPTAMSPACDSTAAILNNSTINLDYFWQLNRRDTIRTRSSLNPLPVTISGMYYVRAKENTTNCWTLKADSVAIIINPSPIPPPPFTSVESFCGIGTLGPVRLSNPERYYWQTSVTGTDLSKNLTTSIVVTQTGTYFLRTRDNITQCWSKNSSAKSFVVFALPSIHAAITTGDSNCDTTSLNIDPAPTGKTYFWQKNNSSLETINNASEPWLVSLTGFYFLKAKDNGNGCWSNADSVLIILNTSPLPLAERSIISCSVAQVSSLNSISGITNYWQLNPMDTLKTETANLEIVKDSTLYLRTKDLVTSCWSKSAVTSIDIIDAPQAPILDLEKISICGYAVVTTPASPASIAYYWTPDKKTNTGVLVSGADTIYESKKLFIKSQLIGSLTECWSTDADSIDITIHPLPAAPSLHDSLTTACFKTTLTLSTLTGITYYWQASPESRDTSNSSNPLTLNKTSKVFVRSRNDVTKCWSLQAPSKELIIDSLPLPVQLEGPTIVCSNEELEYKIISEAAVASYRWILPAGSERIQQADASRIKIFFTDIPQNVDSLKVFPVNQCGEGQGFSVPLFSKEDCLPIHIPNGLTINSNDNQAIWDIKGVSLYPQADIKVFTRHGVLVFESKGNYTPWNGKRNGEDLPAATYYYVIDLKDKSKRPLTGSLTILY